MINLISGKEALIALANGEEVEFKDGMNKWENIKYHMNLDLSMFLTAPDWMEFRLKPRTLNLNGIEVPVCGSNYQEGETIFVFDDCCDERGYIEYSISGYQYQDSIPKLWWHTEDEIKQVVAVLRQVFGAI